MALNFPSPSNSLKPKAHKCKPCSIVIIPVLCAAAYLVGIFQRGGSTPTASFLCSSRKRTQSPADGDTLDFSARHSAGDKLRIRRNTVARRDAFPPCGAEFSEYTPCEDVGRSLKFERERLVYRERHCPKKNESTACLVPAPRGYRVPFRWPERREKVWYANVPHKELTVEKAKQNWVKFEIDGDGEIFSFPGGGTMFPRGADSYIDEIGRLIDLRGGSVRTAIDTGCGVASFGAYLLSRNILTMSFAPRDTHEAQVQFALERGVPALIGVMASKRLPYPARAFDMAHCSRCLIPWAQYNGSYLIEVDRILRPGGYWVLSGPPINWERRWRGWERSPEDLKAEQSAIEATARSLCWKKVVQKGELAVWQKPTNHVHCKMTRKLFKQPLFCGGQDPDRAWYTEMEACLTPMPEVSDIREMAGGKLPRWPERLDTVPPRIGIGGLRGLTAESFYENAGLWKRRVWHYKSIDSQLEDGGRYRNFLDMNAYLGGFAAALSDDPVWVMNVVPVEVEVNTLGVIYERGLIGTYQNWCEAMSTYPRTYDFIHADSVFTLYRDRCEMEGILLEMDRILQPGGGVIIRDHVDMIAKIKFIVDGIKWNTRVFDHEDGPHNTEKILFAGKQYWTVSFDPNLIL